MSLLFESFFSNCDLYDTLARIERKLDRLNGDEIEDYEPTPDYGRRTGLPSLRNERTRQALPPPPATKKLPSRIEEIDERDDPDYVDELQAQLPWGAMEGGRRKRYARRLTVGRRRRTGRR